MVEKETKSAATRFLDAHPQLRQAMSESKIFEQVKNAASLTIDEEQLYIVKGDALGDEDDLYLDALARGAKPSTQDELSRSLFLELDDELKAIVMRRFEKR